MYALSEHTSRSQLSHGFAAGPSLRQRLTRDVTLPRFIIAKIAGINRHLFLPNNKKGSIIENGIGGKDND